MIKDGSTENLYPANRADISELSDDLNISGENAPGLS